MPHPTTWAIDYRIREDEERVFVPAELLRGAQPGDGVEIRSAQPPVSRRGRVVERGEDPTRGEFVIVTLEQRAAGLPRRATPE